MKKKSENFYNSIKGKYLALSEFNGAREPITLKCLNCGNIFETKPRYFTNKDSKDTRAGKCHNCILDPRSKKEEFIQYINKFEDYKLLSEYVHAHDKVKINHLVCGHEYMVRPSYFMGRKQRCPKCARVKQRKEKEFLEYVDSINDYEVVGEYINLHTHIRMLHSVCGKEYNVTPEKFKFAKRRCPHCNGSNGELTIQSFLDYYNIEYIREMKFNDLKYNTNLRMDFYIELDNKKYCIEYHGRQHYEFVEWFHERKENFDKRVLRDNIKKQYCYKNNIEYIEIPYYDFDEIENILIEKLGLTNSLNS